MSEMKIRVALNTEASSGIGSSAKQGGEMDFIPPAECSANKPNQ
jgi:hypothetical protein